MEEKFEIVKKIEKMQRWWCLGKEGKNQNTTGQKNMLEPRGKL